MNIIIITRYGCVFLKLGESTCIYVAMDLIPILLGSLPLTHKEEERGRPADRAGPGTTRFTCDIFAESAG